VSLSTLASLRSSYSLRNRHGRSGRKSRASTPTITLTCRSNKRLAPAEA